MARCVDRVCIVRHLKVSMHTKENVVWLDIGMCDTLFVQVLQSCSCLGNILGGSLVRELLYPPQMLVQHSVTGAFQNHGITAPIVGTPEET